MKFYGYPRHDGKVGARNYVAIIPVVSCVNHIASQISQMVRGTVALRHNQGCDHPPEDIKLVTTTLINLGNNPNVGAVLLISLGCESLDSEKVYEGIKKYKKPVDLVIVHNERGMLASIEKASRIAANMVYDISGLQREEFGLDKLIFSTKCGSSDATSALSSNLVVGEVCKLLIKNGGSFIQSEVCDMMGGEYYLKKLAIDQKEGEKIVDFVRDLCKRGNSLGIDVRGANVSTGNITGGISTLVEKALGANIKGGNVAIQGALEYGKIVPGPGRWIMNAPGRVSENLTGSAAGGAIINLFTTGKGALIGNPILPTIEICGNQKTVVNLADHIDFDCSTIIKGTENIKECGKRLYEYAIKVANGQLTKAEIFNLDKNMEIFIKGIVI